MIIFHDRKILSLNFIISYFFASLCFSKNISKVSFFFLLICFGDRGSHQKVFYKKGVLKNFVNFTGKHLCWSLFLINLQAWRSGTLLKKRLHHICLPVNIAIFLRKSFSMEHLQWLLRIWINVTWFGKYDPFFIFHDAVFLTYPESHDTKT